MTALIGWLISNPAILAIVGGAIAAAVALFKGRRDGAASERAKQALEQQKARDIADEVDNDIGALPTGKAREELKKWAKR